MPISATEREPSAPGKPNAGAREIWSYVRGNRIALAVALALSLVGALATLAQPVFVNQIVSYVGDSSSLGRAPLGLLITVAVSAGAIALEQYLLLRTAESIVRRQRKEATRRILRLTISEYDSREAGDLASRVTNDASALKSLLTDGLLETVGGMAVFVGAIIAMILIDPVLFAAAISVAAVAVVAVSVFSRQMRDTSTRLQESIGVISSRLVQILGSIRTVRADNATAQQIERVDQATDSAYTQGVRIAKIQAVVYPLSTVTAQVALLAVLGVGGYRVADGALSVANMVSFMLYLLMMMSPLGTGITAISSIARTLGAVSRLEEIRRIPPEPTGSTRPSENFIAESESESVRRSLPRLQFESEIVCFDHVSFSYPEIGLGSLEPSARNLAVQDVTFSVRRHSKTALVGPSGAGKSTLFSLIERFYEPDSGEIRFLGTPIRSLEPTVLRSHIAYIEQNAPVLAGTVRENLTIGIPSVDDDSCYEVLDTVHLLHLVTSERGGLDASMGENGSTLSGGERQRLAIARLLLARSELMLLDECTSNLDSRNESDLSDAIDNANQHGAILVIAHRLSTVLNADQIIVLDEGSVVNVGTHEYLLENSLLYRDLAKRQFLIGPVAGASPSPMLLDD